MNSIYYPPKGERTSLPSVFSIVVQLKLEFFSLLPSSAACQYNIAYPSWLLQQIYQFDQLLCLLLRFIIYTPHGRQAPKR